MKTTASLSKQALTILNNLSDVTGVKQERILECLIVEQWYRTEQGETRSYEQPEYPRPTTSAGG